MCLGDEWWDQAQGYRSLGSLSLLLLSLWSPPHHPHPYPWVQLQQPAKQPGPLELAEVTLALYTHVYSQGQMVRDWLRFNATPVCPAGPALRVAER